MNRNRKRKLFEKLLTQSGFRISNAWAKERSLKLKIKKENKSTEPQ